ncbi:FUSC family protein [Paenibacillus sp. 1001270B_150601_E10]|uniref:FUSC family protein n=1 Tax=Paenibacillus sp. 1001270B_150601_E10 TaxID=2787079 RepID=UPI00189F4E80|nr:aromatic acid exporter family protein [Paenibacillus sp. 1001270B_150601_E10]
MALGARVLKTGMAVAMTIYLCMLFKQDSPVIAAVAAIFAMQPSIYRSWRYFLDQLQANTFGAMIALGAGMVLSNEPIMIGIICILVIMLSLKMKMEDTIGLTLVTVIAVMEASGQWDYALLRFAQILIGIGSACFINVIFLPPNPKKQFIQQIEAVFNQMSLLLRTSISDEMTEAAFHQEKRELEKSMQSLADKFKLFEEEIKKLKRAKFSRTRHVVVYKQLLYTLQRGMEVLDSIENHYFQSIRGEGIDHKFDEHLEHLIRVHEHVLLKFEDKVKKDTEIIEHLMERNEEFLETMMKACINGDDSSHRLAIVVAACYEYGLQIQRLDRLAGHANPVPEKENA